MPVYPCKEDCSYRKQEQDCARRRNMYSQIILGSAAGFVTGYVTTKIGKNAAIIIGGTVIFVEVANLEGYLNIDWEKVSQNLVNWGGCLERIFTKKKPQQWIDGRTFTTANVICAISFIGGAFIGFGVS